MKNKQNNVSLFERQGLWYEANSLVPFTGMVDSYYENGQLEVFARYVVGVQAVTSRTAFALRDGIEI